MDSSGDKSKRVKEVGLKKLLTNEGSIETIEELRETHRERSKKERLELAYGKILKDPEEGSGSEGESTDEDYSPEESEDSVTLSDEDLSDDYAPIEDIGESMRQTDMDANEDMDESLRKGTRRSKRLASKTVY